MPQLDVRVWGQGVPVVLVHGSLDTGDEAWQGQRSLSDEGYRLVVVNRRGYGDSPNGGGEDYLRDAHDVVELLEDGAHVVGHSYGGLAALFAAADRPESVLSLTLIEPPAFAIHAEDTAVAAFIEQLQAFFAQRALSDREFLEGFLELVGASPDEIPGEMLDAWVERVPLLREGRPAWEAEVPLDRLASHGLPALVVSGGHDAAFEAVCDELARRLDARKATITGAGHEVPMMADALNETLISFWRSS